MEELKGLGEEFVEAFYIVSPILERVPGNYRQESLWYELSAVKSVHVLYHIAKMNSEMTKFVNRLAIKMQPFPLRHSFIPPYVPFNLTVIASQILHLLSVHVSQHSQNPQRF